jgi:hypothetical protein
MIMTRAAPGADSARYSFVLCRFVYHTRMEKPWGGVKPHGRLGPLRSERLAALPRAAYRRSSLLRPFRELTAPGRVHLGGRFPLRCFQRLSPPAIATRRCSWRHNRDTSGPSDPVLSY